MRLFKFYIALICIVAVVAADAGILLFAKSKKASKSLEESVTDTERLLKNFEYLIGPEDSLEMFVWRNPDLCKSVTVRPDGKITLPIIDEVYVSGLTPGEVDKIVTEKYSEFINNPQISIFVNGFGSKKVCVLGEVGRPGVYPLMGRLTVLELITQARYDKAKSQLKSVVVIREKDGKAEGIRLNLVKAIKKRDLSQNIALEPGDIVFVPSSFIAELNIFVDLFFSKTKPAIDFYLAGYKAIYSPGSSQ